MVRIAVVDDDETFADMMTEMFSLRGWETLRFFSAADAQGALAGAQPDVIVLDLRLESKDSGRVLLESLSASPATQSIPVIICSADSRQLSRHTEYFLSRGATVLAKPFEIRDLFALVVNALDRKCAPAIEPAAE